MPRTSKAKAEPKPATETKAYRHTRTGAVRHSSSPLGYPYEAIDTKVTKAEAKAEEAESA